MAEMTEMTNTFYEFFKNNNIKIPIIQRDYAQGRKTVKATNVRESFLNSLKDSLDNNKIRDLNFVYGTEKKGDSNKIKPTFYPVDGQQRLTTLFLLHYYLFIIAGKTGELKECGEFLYETRSSAEDFFRWLRDCEDNLVNTIKRDDDVELSECIRNMPEYQAVWNNDPTVSSAITMLSDIKKKFGNNNNYYNILTDQNCPIHFSVIPPEEAENEEAAEKADKTYIRMNARGKVLEDFENLRAAVDGIREKIKDDNWNTDIIDNYDQKYINTLFNSLDVNIGLKEKTDCINSKSENIFKNIYNIVCLSLNGNNCTYEGNKTNYRYHIYEIAKSKDLLNHKDIFQKYIDMTDRYFKYLSENSECVNNGLSLEENYISDSDSYSKEEATVLYCYFYGKEHSGSIPQKKQVELLLYVLENLNIQNWANLHKNLYAFCEKVSKDQDTITYFSNLTCDLDKSLFPGVFQDNLNVRFKEQRLKAKIITDLKLDKKYFDEFEKNMSGRKLQFMLYAAGYWKEYNSGDFQALEVYLKKALKWLGIKAKPEDITEFRKAYAMSAYIDKDALMSADEIQKKCIENKHIWDSSFSFWNDDEEKNFNLVDEKCKILKRTFEKNDPFFADKKDFLVNKPDYETSWLKYAVMYDGDELLKNRLTIAENDELDIDVMDAKGSSKTRPYYLYVAMLKNPGWKWGDEEFEMFGVRWNGRKMFKYESCFPYSLTRDDYPFSYNGTTYQFSVEYTYNITLAYIDAINIGFCKTNNCLINVSDNNGILLYERYTKDPNIINGVIKENFNMTDQVKNVISRCKKEHETMAGYKKEDYLYLYYNYKELGIKKPNDYEKESGNSRKWKKVYSNSVTLSTQSKELIVDVL